MKRKKIIEIKLKGKNIQTCERKELIVKMTDPEVFTSKSEPVHSSSKAEAKPKKDRAMERRELKAKGMPEPYEVKYPNFVRLY